MLAASGLALGQACKRAKRLKEMENEIEKSPPADRGLMFKPAGSHEREHLGLQFDPSEFGGAVVFRGTRASGHKNGSMSILRPNGYSPKCRDLAEIRPSNARPCLVILGPAV